MRRRHVAAALMAVGVMAQACAHQLEKPELRFSIDDGAVRNEFLRSGPVAAHVVLKSGAAPRLVVAFPAGNSGAGIWFRQSEATAIWSPARDMRPVKRTLNDGAEQRGVSFTVKIEAQSLEIQKAVLGSIRVLRDYQHLGAIAPAVETPSSVESTQVTWERRRLDGAAGYFLSVEAVNGRVTGPSAGGLLSIETNGEKGLELRVTAFSGDAPLTGVPEPELLSGAAANDSGLRRVLAFLSYEEKFLAGSWQYDTYFGRDTLMTLALLDDALQPHAVEAGLASVLERLSETGEVAHEEDIAEFALLRRAERGEAASIAPILDYKMIDDDFLLAPVLARYLLDRPDAVSRVRPFLARRRADGANYRDLLERNLRFVIDAARPFGDAPIWSNLIRVRSDEPPVGNWRDSNSGLGGGVYPYDVNVALVPAALNAAERLYKSGVLGDDETAKSLSGEARRLQNKWAAAAAMFRVVVDPSTSPMTLHGPLHPDGIVSPSVPPPGGARVVFSALALDRFGAPVPVMHSDVGFDLFFGSPPPRRLEEAARLVSQSYPRGLMTPAGMLVANAVYAPEEVSAGFGRDRYHGAVVWSWQQALMAAGIVRQLTRTDLPVSTRHRLEAARCALSAAIERSKQHRASELWTWTIRSGAIESAPFGESEKDETESNAAQLWSTVFLQTKLRSPPIDGRESCPTSAE